VITNNPRNMTGSAMNDEHLIQIICNDPRLTRKYVNELQSASQSFQLRPIAWFAGVRQRPRVEASVFLLDESGLEDQSKEGLQATVTELVEIAPVVMVAASVRQPELKLQISAGAADFVARSGNFVPVAVGLVERRIRFATEGVLGRSDGPDDGRSRDFGEILRHEVNNPLTGILGNAEMLLARRDRLPASAIERLETIANLAVRLRETVQRLSSAAELRQIDTP
jgi:signal transduction histidine kinase